MIKTNLYLMIIVLVATSCAMNQQTQTAIITKLHERKIQIQHETPNKVEWDVVLYKESMVDEYVVENLCNIGKIATIEIRDPARISPNDMEKMLEDCDSVHHVIFRGQFGDDRIEKYASITKMVRLKHVGFNIYNKPNNFDGKIIRLLSELPDLEQFYIAGLGGRVSNEDLLTLKKNKKLKSVSFSNTQLESLDPFLELPYLEGDAIAIAESQISTAEIARLYEAYKKKYGREINIYKQ